MNKEEKSIQSQKRLYHKQICLFSKAKALKKKKSEDSLTARNLEKPQRKAAASLADSALVAFLNIPEAPA